MHKAIIVLIIDLMEIKLLKYTFFQNRGILIKVNKVLILTDDILIEYL